MENGDVKNLPKTDATTNNNTEQVSHVKECLKATTSGPHQFCIHCLIMPCRSIMVACSIGKVYTNKQTFPMLQATSIDLQGEI